jgi:putative SOS response-associated peptidase YedK
MCGRYDNLIPRDAYAGLFKAMRLPPSNFPARYNVAPTDQIPIVRIDPRDGTREVVMARWGLIPFWMKEKPKVPHINAAHACRQRGGERHRHANSADRKHRRPSARRASSRGNIA